MAPGPATRGAKQRPPDGICHRSDGLRAGGILLDRFIAHGVMSSTYGRDSVRHTARPHVQLAPPTPDHRPSRTSLDRARKIAPHHLRFFFKTEKQFGPEAARNGLVILRRRRAFPLGRTMRDLETDVMAAL
jgi:hypothetical protein